jgi:nucleoside-diphosphate-sugar epimerase
LCEQRLFRTLTTFPQVPIFVPKHLESLRTSYVYVKDVARALLYLIDKGIKDEVYNVAFEGTWTLQELLQILAGILGKEVEFDPTATEPFSLFPSVTRGGVDVSKLKATGFQPTDFTVALNVCYVDWSLKHFRL